MRYTILDIIEWDYGCEGIPDGEEPMCSVVVRDEKGVAAVCNAVRDFQGESGPFLGTEIYCH